MDQKIIPKCVVAGARPGSGRLSREHRQYRCRRDPYAGRTLRITKAVGAYKATHALPASDPAREERQIARLRALAMEAQLDPDFGEKFLRFIIQEVIRHHEQASARE